MDKETREENSSNREKNKRHELWKRFRGWIPGAWQLVICNLLLPPLTFVILRNCSPSSYVWITLLAFALQLWLNHRGSYCQLANEYTTDDAIDKIKKNEIFLRVVRWIHYLFALLLVLDENFLELGILQMPFCVQAGFGKGYLLILFTLVLFFDFFASLSRTTFRKWPTNTLAFASSLLFLVFMGLPYPDENAWGVADLTKITEQLNGIKSQIKGGVLIAAISSLGLFFARELYSRYKDKTVGDPMKDTRRQLLTHWGFNATVPVLSNSLATLIAAYSVICALALFSAANPLRTGTIELPKDSYRFSLTTGVETKESFKSVSSATIVVPKDTDKDDNSDNDDDTDTGSISFCSYLAFAASVLQFFGLIFHFNISDKSLAESEYYYLLYHSLYFSKSKKLPFSIRAYNNRWTDYCQVMAYSFTDESSITSEAQEWHRLEGVLKALYCQRESCDKSHFLSGILFAYSEIKEKRSLSQAPSARREGTTGRAEEGNKSKPTMPEIIFSATILGMLSQETSCQAAAYAASCIDEQEQIRRELRNIDVLYEHINAILTSHPGNAQLEQKYRELLRDFRTQFPNGRDTACGYVCKHAQELISFVEDVYTSGPDELKPIMAKCMQSISQIIHLLAPVAQGQEVESARIQFGVDVIPFVTSLQEFYFSSDFTRKIEEMLCASSLPAEDFIRIIQLDMLCLIMQKHTSRDCLLWWLCKRDHCVQSREGENNAADQNKRILLLEYPFLVYECMKRHWPYEKDPALFADDIVGYFDRLAALDKKTNEEQEFVTDKKQELDAVVQGIYSFLSERNNEEYWKTVTHFCNYGRLGGERLAGVLAYRISQSESIIKTHLPEWSGTATSGEKYCCLKLAYGIFCKGG